MRIAAVEPELGWELTCTVCGSTKDASLFVKSQRPLGRIRECKACRKERNDKDRKSDSYRGNVNRRLVIEAKSKPCMDCNIEFPYYVMDLDHVRGEKKFILSQAYSYSTKAVLEEIAKCDVICANCHRVRTFTESGVED
jgi:hypothetical protein